MSEPVPADPSTGVRQVRYDLFVMEEGATWQNRFQQTRVQVYARYAMTSLTEFIQFLAAQAILY